MPRELFASQPTTTVSSGGTTAPAAGTTESWTVASSAGFPAASAAAVPPSQFHVADTAAGKTGEIITVTTVSGTTWTVTRGAEGTTPVAHTAGFTIYQVVTAGGYAAFTQEDYRGEPQPSGDAFQRVGVVSYFYPTWFAAGGGAWATFMAGAPYAGFCILNPDSGPGVSLNTDYVTQSAQAHGSGMLVLGYVDTNYAAVPASTVKSQMGSYLSWYTVDGFFLDRAANDAGNQPYYVSLYQYAKQVTGGYGMVVINPGAVTDSSYVHAADVICTFEGDLADYLAYPQQAWTRDYPASLFYHIIYGCSAQQRDLALGISRSYRAGWVYVTDNTLPDPYNNLPGTTTGDSSYWPELIAKAAAPPSAWTQGPLALEPAGATGVTMPRRDVTSSALTAASGTVYLRGIYLDQGITVSNLNFVTGTTAKGGGSHGWYVLCDQNRVVRAVSADQTDAAATWGTASTTQTLSVTASTYVTAYSGLYYAGFCVAASTMPTFCGAASTAAGIAGITPVLSGSSSTAQTTPPAAGSTLATITATAGSNFYAWTS